jgi:hypothetical protein
MGQFYDLFAELDRGGWIVSKKPRYQRMDVGGVRQRFEGLPQCGRRSRAIPHFRMQGAKGRQGADMLGIDLKDVLKSAHGVFTPAQGVERARTLEEQNDSLRRNCERGLDGCQRFLQGGPLYSHLQLPRS